MDEFLISLPIDESHWLEDKRWSYTRRQKADQLAVTVWFTALDTKTDLTFEFTRFCNASFAITGALLPVEWACRLLAPCCKVPLYSLENTGSLPVACSTCREVVDCPPALVWNCRIDLNYDDVSSEVHSYLTSLLTHLGEDPLTFQLELSYALSAFEKHRTAVDAFALEYARRL